MQAPPPRRRLARALAIGASAAAAGLAVGLALVLPPPSSPAPPPVAAAPGARAPYLPDPTLTPGALNPALTFEVLTAPGFTTKAYRNVPQSEKDAVYRRYGLDPKHHVSSEVDHLVSLELGGANDVTNLWPEPFYLNVGGREMGAHEKDHAEDTLAAAVRKRAISLPEAQAMIRGDWTVAYRRFVAPEFPAFTGGPTQGGAEPPEVN